MAGPILSQSGARHTGWPRGWPAWEPEWDNRPVEQPCAHPCQYQHLSFIFHNNTQEFNRLYFTPGFNAEIKSIIFRITQVLSFTNALLSKATPFHSWLFLSDRVCVSSPQGTFGREPQAKPDDDRYLRAAIQEYDNIAKLGQIMREGPIKVRQQMCCCPGRPTQINTISKESLSLVMYSFFSIIPKTNWETRSEDGTLDPLQYVLRRNTQGDPRTRRLGRCRNLNQGLDIPAMDSHL